MSEQNEEFRQGGMRISADMITTGTITEKTPLQRETMRLDSQLEDLWNALHQMFEKVGPVLSPLNEDSVNKFAGDDATTQKASQMAEWVAKQNHEIANMIRSVRGVTSQIEL